MSKFVLTAQLQLQAPTNTRQIIDQLRNQLSGGLNVPITVTGGAKAQKQVNDVTKATKQANTAAQNMGKSFGLAFKRFAAFTVASRAVSLFTNTLANAVDEAIDFQREMVKISQVTGKAMKDLQGLERTIFRLSKTLGVNSKELLSTTRILSQAGIQARDLDIALAALAKTTLAPTFEDISQTAEGAIAILAQFKQGVGALEGQLGSINSVAGQFAVESGDLIGAIRRTGGVFKEAGGSLDEFLGLFTSIRATTRESSESIATGLRTIFTRLQRPRTLEFLKQYGVELTDLEGKFVGPYEAVRRLNQAIGGLEQGDITFIKIAEEIAGFRQIGKVIPLLKEFELAERARAAAIDGTSSLTDDAAKAQQALAVQIIKVKQEFQELIQGIANTSTFQAFVKTSLSLASALIKIADAIKPLIPLLAAMAAFKFARGLGGFAKGIGGALRGASGKNQGGRIHAFARGGMVPGQGNRDTVPAMLSPGEFVIRKSSVKKMGAGNLAAMNENRYNRGGMFDPRNAKQYLSNNRLNAFSNIPIPGSKGKFFTNAQLFNANHINKPGVREGKFALEKEARAKWGKGVNAQYPGGAYSSSYKKIGALILKPGFKKGEEGTIGGLQESSDLRKDKKVLGPKGEMGLLKGSTYGLFYAARANLANNKAVNQSIEDGTRVGLKKTVQGTAKNLANGLKIPGISGINNKEIKKAANAVANDMDGAVQTTEGYILEGLFSAITGSSLAGGGSSFDLPNLSGSNKKRIEAVFGAAATRLSKADVKRSKGGATSDDGGVISKTLNDMSKGNVRGLRKYASGGSVKDTVPALLTPGEFVVNKSSAQSIGYNNLSSMNKSGVAKFNKGGIVGVQRFAEGGGVMGGGAVQFAVASAAIGTLTTAVTALGTEADGTKNAFGRVSDVLVSWATTIAAAIFALKQFGFAVSAKGIMEFFGKGPKSLGGLLSQAKGAISGGLKGATKSSASGTGAFGQAPVTGQTNKAMTGLQNSIAGVANKIKDSGIGEGLSQMKSGMKQLFPTFASWGSSIKSGTTASGSHTASVLTSTLTILKETKARLADSFSRTKLGRGIKNFRAGQKGSGAFEVTDQLTKGGKRKLGSIKGEDSMMWRMGKKTRNLPSRMGKGIAKKFPGMGKLGSGALKLGRGAMSMMGMGGGVGTTAAGGAVAAGGGLMAVAGPAAAAAAAVALLSAGLNAAFDAQGKYNEAIREGNVAEAEKYAVLKEAPGLIQLFGEGASEAWVVLKSAFGGETLKTIKQRAKVDALAGKIEAEKAKNTRDASEAMLGFTRGTQTAEQALAAMSKNFVNAANLAAAEQELVKGMEDDKSTGAGAFGRDAAFWLGGGLFGMETSSQKNSRIQEEQDKIDKESTEKLASAFSSLRSSSAPLQKSLILSGKSFDDFINASGGYGAFTSDQIQKLKGDFDAQKKAIQANIAFIKALNFGLRDVNASATAAAVGMDLVASAGEAGFNSFAASAEILEAAVSSAGGKISGGEMDAAITDLEGSLRQFGASDEQVDKTTGTLRGLQAAQAGTPAALEATKKDLQASGDLSDINIKETLGKNLLKGVEGPAKEKLAAAIENLKIDDAMRAEIQAGNLDKVLEQTLDPVTKAASEQAIGLLKKRAEMENKLISSLKNRAAQEAEYISAQKGAIDTQLEAGKLFESFGGAKQTSGQQLGARIAQANLSLGNAGVSGLSSGGATDIRGAMDEIQRSSQAQNARANAAVAARGRGVAGVKGFDNAAGFDEDKRDELKQANKALVDFTKQRISLIQEELKIAQQKNKAEKDALDKLLGGDVEGFLEQQLAATAGAALRIGDAGVASAFGAGALGAGFKTLEGQGLSGKETERAASLALSSVGVSDPRAAQVMAGTTAEEEGLKAEGRELSQVLGDAAQQSATLEKMDVTAATVVIKAQEMKIDQFNKNPEGALAGVEGFRRGGVVYANRGMFVPRGTDTVPAMLTPGEFVVNRAAVRSGNNLSILRSMNGAGAGAGATGMARGGMVYMQQGGLLKALGQGLGSLGTDISSITDSIGGVTEQLTTSLAQQIGAMTDVFNPIGQFASSFEASVQKLMDFQLNVKVDPTNVTVNFQGGSFLSTLKEDIKNELLDKVKEEIGNAKFTESGEVRSRPGNLP